jgi:tetratricopeptide (TPR) repeat protein
VAQQFSKGGFDAKAVAIYKQILRVDDACLEARIQLGDHFQRMGLASDALREFQLAVKHCQAHDLKREAFDQLKKVALLDPGNIPNRLNLASLMLRQDLEDDARQEFTLLLKEVARHTSAEMAIRVAEATLDAFPTHKEALETLASVKISTGSAKEAIPLLTKALPHFDDDIEFRQVLVNAYEAVGDDEGVKSVYRGIAEIYKSRGDPEKARDILQRHAAADAFLEVEENTEPSILLTDVEDQLATGGNEYLAADFEGGIGDGAPIDAAFGDSFRASEPVISADDLLAEAKVSLEFGDAEEAERLTRQVLERDPSNADAEQLLARIAEPDGVSAQRGASDGGMATAQDDDSLAALPDIELVLDDEEDRDDQFATIDPPAEVPTQPPAVLEPSEAEIEIDIDLEEDQGAGEEIESAPVAGATDSHVFEAEDWSAGSAQISEDLEEAEFFIGQGMIPEAERLLRDVLARVPHHPKAMLRLGEILNDRGEDATYGASAELLEDTLVEDGVDAHELPAIPEIELDTGGARSDATKTATRSARASKEATGPETESLDDLLADAEAAVAAVQPAPDADFDLAAELEDGDQGGRTAGEKSGTAFDEVFAAFKKGIQDQVGEEESETHYDLAIAYKEMGLLEDAVRELEIVQRAGARPAETLSLMATCKMELGEPAVAATHLADALAIVGESGESAVSLRYDLGEALLAAGRQSEALEAFKKVAGRQPAFRDVADRIAELS